MPAAGALAARRRRSKAVAAIPLSAWPLQPGLAGVDEAGRGPLAGPVVAAAVMLDPAQPIAGLADSKQLEPEQRLALAARIRESAPCWAIGVADHEEIDALNILGATLLAMRRALLGLALRPQAVVVDGNRLPRLDDLECAADARTIVQGDASHASIAAASILAKTWRDQLMEQLDTRFPGYGFATHKGYPTPRHLAALRQLGPSAVHRRSFGPVKSVLSSGSVPPGSGS
ncbi:MAG: ribonuclease HII [Sinobacteraceae bacterium]|nr:ribonuclease HII [Nevskiaceae bacterium]MCP5360613.1 ribonuclease HII [Nevskiaceae bacterium]MCP5467227.1 ribonuclease HII [Nevskiaceae bacterium]